MDPARAAELLAAERRASRTTCAASTPSSSPTPPRASPTTSTTATRAADLTDRERDLGRIEELREELAAIERAEKRLAEGTYGISIVSGEPISDRRLESIPYAERTAEEQRLFERGLL